MTSIKRVALWGCLLASAAAVRADDLSDGISEFTDESVAAEQDLQGKDLNVSFIITDALAQAQRGKKSDKKDPKKRINLNDGSGDSNENSVVVESGGHVDTVINIVEEK